MPRYGQASKTGAETGNGDAIPRSPKLNNVNDDFILDLAQASRAAADRGRLLTTSPTNENELVLTPLPTIPTIPAAPTWAQAFTGGTVTVSDGTETIVQTLSITPRSAATRIFAQAHIDVATATTQAQGSRDVGAQLRLYRGTTRIAFRVHRGSRYAQNESIQESLVVEFLDTPNSTAAQTYTARFARVQGTTSWTISNRQIIAREVLP